MKNRRQRAAKVPPFSKKGRRKQGRFERNWGEMSPALRKVAKRRQRAKDIEAKWKQKVCPKQDWKFSGGDRSVDRISMLPDEVLQLILSHLTLKEQMACSILSRRWRYLWTLTTRLEFDGTDSILRLNEESNRSLCLDGIPVAVDIWWRRRERSMEKIKLKYVSWVNRVLASCQSPTIDDFRLCFNFSQDDGGYIYEFLRYALAKKVKTLVLNFKDHLCHTTECTVRRTVDEWYVFPSWSLHMDEEIHFKHLEKLSLDYVRVDHEALNFFLHNCPLLKDLSISNSPELATVSIIGPFPSLKRLVISWCGLLSLLEIRDVENLVYVGYDGRDIQLLLHNLPKLVNLCVPVRIFEHMNQSSSILQQLEALYLIKAICQFSFPAKMSNLKQFEITCQLISGHESHRWLADLIQSVPSLQKLVLKIEVYARHPRYHERKLKRMKMKRKKLYRELKEVEVVGFRGLAPSDLEFVWHMVDNAVGLKRVVIDPTVNGPFYSHQEITALDRVEMELALEVPGKIKVDFLRPPSYPSRLRYLKFFDL